MDNTLTAENNHPEESGPYLLHQGAIRFLGRASIAMKEGNLSEAHENIVRSVDIIAELMGSLSMESGGMASNLFRLYEYMHYCLVQANIRRDPEPVDEVIRFLKELRPAWQFAARSA